MTIFEKIKNYQYVSPTNLEEFWTVVTGLTGIFGIILVVAQLAYVSIQLRRARRQFELSQAGETSRIFFDVMDRWSIQYENRCKLLAKPAVTADQLRDTFGSDPSALLADDTWQTEIRPLLNFFEFLGVLISNDKLNQAEVVERIFTLVTVDNYPNQNYEKENGTLYAHLTPYLIYLRSPDYSGYRPDIYEYYDGKGALIDRYIAYQKSKTTAQKANITEAAT
jgi:hypothetical protein